MTIEDVSFDRQPVSEQALVLAVELLDVLLDRTFRPIVPVDILDHHQFKIKLLERKFDKQLRSLVGVAVTPEALAKDDSERCEPAIPAISPSCSSVGFGTDDLLCPLTVIEVFLGPSHHLERFLDRSVGIGVNVLEYFVSVGISAEDLVQLVHIDGFP